MKKENSSRQLTNRLLAVVLVIGLVAIVMSSYAIFNPQTKTVIVYRNVTTTTINSTKANVQGYNITSNLIEPPITLSDAPVILQNESFGKRLTDINQPFNASELAIINNAPNSYYETAGEMFLNHTLNNSVGVSPVKLPLFIVNGKPTVIYLGSITCIFCGENRWAMLLALSRFGNFSNIFKGYSSLGDGDLPTVYWAPAHYNISSTQSGSYYNSNYINFIMIEDANPISGGFNLNSLSTIQQRVNATGNTAYEDAVKYIISTNAFGGTPFTIWGAYEVPGADAVVLGNTPPTSSTYPLQQMTHQQVLDQFANPNNQFAWSDYAAADLYIAMVCATIGNVNNAPSVCSLPAIKGIEASQGLQ